MSTPRRILIIRPSALGDVCRTVPVLASLKRAWPGAAIDWVVQDDFAPAVSTHPDLHEAVLFPRRRWARWWRQPSAARDVHRWVAGLRHRRYDLVLDCQGLGRSGLMAWATRAPRRLGPRGARELAWLGYTETVDCDAHPHTVDRMLALAHAAGADPVPDLRLYAHEADLAWWEQERRERGVAGAPYAVLAPTSRWASKRWPSECWSALPPSLRSLGLESCVVVGAPGEREQVSPWLETGTDGVVDLLGRTSIGQTMALIASASLVIANDSAPLHMAVGFDRPCVGLFGPTDPAQVGAYGREAYMLRGHDRHANGRVHYRDARLRDELMRSIASDDVLACADRALRDGASPPAGARPAAAPREASS